MYAGIADFTVQWMGADMRLMSPLQLGPCG